MQNSKIESLKKLRVCDNEIIQIKVSESCSHEEMGILASLMKTDFPNLEGKWIITKNDVNFEKLTLLEIDNLIQKLQNVKKKNDEKINELKRKTNLEFNSLKDDKAKAKFLMGW